MTLSDMNSWTGEAHRGDHFHWGRGCFCATMPDYCHRSHRCYQLCGVVQQYDHTQPFDKCPGPQYQMWRGPSADGYVTEEHAK